MKEIKESQEKWGTGEVKTGESVGSSRATGITDQDLETYVKRLLQLLGRPDRAFKDHMIRMLLKDPVVALVYDKNIYGSKKIHLPSPQFVVFYNGIEDLPERSVMRLSDAYEYVDDPEDIALDLKVQVININYGKNVSLMEKSPTLAQYAIFVDTARKYEKDYEHMEAVELAISECIEKGILADFLRKNKAEVLRMCLFEYDQEKHLRMEREDAYEDGEKRGIEIGTAQGEKRMASLTEKLVEQNRTEDLMRAVKDVAFREKLYLDLQING